MVWRKNPKIWCNGTCHKNQQFPRSVERNDYINAIFDIDGMEQGLQRDIGNGELLKEKKVLLPIVKVLKKMKKKTMVVVKISYFLEIENKTIKI